MAKKTRTPRKLTKKQLKEIKGGGALSNAALALSLAACASPAAALGEPGAEAAVAGPARGARAATVDPRSDVLAYLRTFNSPQKYYSRRNTFAPADDLKKLLADTETAVKAYEYLKGRKVSLEDPQKHFSFDFYMATGSASFNPNAAQTNALRGRLNDFLSAGPYLQVDAIYEALVAADGNLTMAFGSLAELYCDDRARLIRGTADMDDEAGKNYYRFAGAFIGLHGPLIRQLGGVTATANILGNPIVYGGAEIVDWWREFIRTGRDKGGVNTMQTIGPDGAGNIVDKANQLEMGINMGVGMRMNLGKIL